MKSKVTGILLNWAMSPIHRECSKGEDSIGVEIFFYDLGQGFQMLTDIISQMQRKFPREKTMQNLINFYHWQGLGVMPTSLSLSLFCTSGTLAPFSQF